MPPDRYGAGAGAVIAAPELDPEFEHSGGYGFVWGRDLAFIVLAPVIGLGLGFGLMVITLWTVRSIRPSRVDALFRRLQQPPGLPGRLGGLDAVPELQLSGNGLPALNWAFANASPKFSPTPMTSPTPWPG